MTHWFERDFVLFSMASHLAGLKSHSKPTLLPLIIDESFGFCFQSFRFRILSLSCFGCMMTIGSTQGKGSAGYADGKGKGGKGSNGGPSGDLIVIIRVSPHKLFTREGRTLNLSLPVTFPEATLGADIQVPTYGGESVTLRLPPGTESGKTFRVKGKGITVGTSTGDFFVTVEIAIPKELNDQQISSLQQYAQTNPENPRENLGNT